MGGLLGHGVLHPVTMFPLLFDNEDNTVIAQGLICTRSYSVETTVQWGNFLFSEFLQKLYAENI